MQKLLFTSVTFQLYFEEITDWNSKQKKRKKTEKQKKQKKQKNKKKKPDKNERLTLVSIRREVKPTSPQNCYGQ